MAAQGREEPADETGRSPIGQSDPAAGSAHADQLGGCSRLVRREHHAERGQHTIERRFLEGQRLRVGRKELCRQAFCASTLSAAVK